MSDTALTSTVTETTSAPDETTSASTSGAALNDDGFRLLQSRDFDGALPLLEQAVSVLAGSGTLAEAYASYNLAFTRFALGSCDGVTELLDRSEEVQGDRPEIDRLRREVERSCEDEDEGRGKGKKKKSDDD